ncbi:hypothetical protein SAMN06265348_113192 [Pedobacter westerhofensis]|uniref:Uncharacterized protein n=1 Tax=Pedobacter westerhofensis TaxID=425512 RepID=A0A521FLL6_9SPHI|nr:hypothetical protein [Pedobacter westerhofensis]SMO96964.1 hypothetical protein SAMN06265348_113192 [Pedobacter westerhofensis]
MKKHLIFIFGVMFMLNAYSQTKSAVNQDVILKSNGEEMRGKVTQVSDFDIHFVYAGETAEYIIKKSDVLKITHSSGRIETFGQAAQPAETRKNDPVAMSASPADHHNKIAILPFAFLMDRQAGAAEIGIKAQEDTYAFLSKHAAGYTIVDVRSTNAALIKAGITRDKMMGFTMKEIGDILGAEYIIDGTITQNKGYATSSSYGNTNTDVKRKSEDKVKVNGSEYSNSNSVQRYDVSVSLNIYMDNNASIYNQTHKAFLTNTDGSYSSPLEYLLKRCPLYRK